MNAYSGNEPFVFVSYSHLDNELAEKIITGLKQSMCRVWYDEGLSVGESWNDKLAAPYGCKVLKIYKHIISLEVK